MECVSTWCELHHRRKSSSSADSSEVSASSRGSWGWWAERIRSIDAATRAADCQSGNRERTRSSVNSSSTRFRCAGRISAKSTKNAAPARFHASTSIIQPSTSAGELVIPSSSACVCGATRSGGLGTPAGSWPAGRNAIEATTTNSEMVATHTTMQYGHDAPIW